jgi:hypothetical protein
VIKSLNWKLIGLFFIKLFLYLLLIPILAELAQEFTFRIALQVLFKTNKISGPSSISMQIWAMMAFVIYTCLFYVYCIFNRYIKLKSNRRLMLILFILIPGMFAGGPITIYAPLTIMGNIFYNGSFYLLYHITGYFVPSFRTLLNKNPQ